ncbi:SRPBCC family protein [Extibacter muris]|uniref:Polyketide cyclase n=1 Tax=Extibacter muris TaxID=1796622 RepID=A0A4R4FC58_9FIRM|nr:SRPBCC family protein [Extibacter muris]MCU0079763.1 SRPBCC family protein [Extibacter muris]TDA20858.1 polyketide cyclase [Extibacter muris]
MKQSTITAQFPCDIKTVWDIVVDNENYRWRSDLSKIVIIDENRFDEYTTSGFITHFRITAKEPYKEYRFAMENENMSGNWSGIFERHDGGTQITFTEEVQVKKAIMNLFVKGYLKKQQTKYIDNLKAAIEQQTNKR